MLEKENEYYEQLFISDLAVIYEIYVTQLRIKGINPYDKNLSSKKTSSDKDKDAIIFVSNIFKTIMSLSEDEKLIIDFEFFHRQYSSWWITRYSLIEYRNLYKDAVHTFYTRYLENEKY